MPRPIAPPTHRFRRAIRSRLGPAVALAVIAVASGACSGNKPSATTGAATSPPRTHAPTAGAPGGTPTARPGSGQGSQAPQASTGGDPAGLAITLEPFAPVPGGPLAMTAPDDGSNRLFVAAQDGKIWSVEADGTVHPNPMVDLGPRLRSGGEQGLLGIAVHPDFPNDPRVFVNYTDTAGDTIVASLTLDPADPNRFNPDSHRQLLFVDQPYANHNGGGVLFGPDRDLYLSLGDGGSGGDPQGNGQRLDTLLGKILRIDVGAPGDRGYTIPDGNPFAGGKGEDEIWHYGLRNPWRLSFDRETGDLWIGDVGQGSFEEVDVARSGVGGLNFGWNVMEGSHCYGTETCSTDGLTLPIADYGRDLGCTVIGGYVYRGSKYEFARGTYVFADYCTGNILAVDSAATSLVAPTVVGSAPNGMSAFGEGADGELYVMNLAGEVSRVVATQR